MSGPRDGGGRAPTLNLDIGDLQRRLRDAEAALEAIRNAEVDAIIVAGPEGPVTYTLTGADEPYRLLVEQIREAALTLSDDGVILYSNSRLPAILGREHGSLLGTKLLDAAVPGDRLLLSALLAKARGGPAKAEVRLRDAAGEVVPVLVSLNSLHSETFSGTFAVITDLTEQRRGAAVVKAERLMRAVFEQVTHAIVVCDANGVISRANAVAAELCGSNPLLACFDAAFPLDRPFVELTAGAAAAGAAATGEYRLHRAGADPLDLLVGVKALGHDDDSAWVVTLTDISTRKRAEQLQRQGRELAEAANRAKSEFLANMSHEIRTPMAAILGYADLLAARLDDAESVAAVETMRRNGRHLLTLINDLLDLSKIEAGKLTVERTAFDLRELIGEVASLMSVRAEEKRLAFTLDYAGPVPDRVETDPARLRQVLINLLGNAVKFTERGGVHLEVRYRDAPRPVLTVVISDTGIGIDAEQQARLFEPFEQADTSTARAFGGTGLGLSICRRLVSLLGGDLVLDSAPGRGSTFAASFPVGRLPSAVPDKPPPGVPASTPPRLNGHILVVEDHPDIRVLVEKILTDAGATTEAADGGAAALELTAAAQTSGRPFAAVVMDMQMAAPDGYQTTARLRSEGYRLPIVALTANAMSGQRDQCLRAGCTDYLSKPVDGRALVEMLARHLSAGPRVLLIEDHDDARRATAGLLTMLGGEVRAAADAEAARRAIDDFVPDLVLCDVDLDGQDGYELLVELRQYANASGSRFITLSGRTADPARARRAGVDRHLIKPVELTVLRALLDHIAGRAGGGSSADASSGRGNRRPMT